MLLPIVLSMLGATTGTIPSERLEVSAGASMLLSVSPYAGSVERAVNVTLRGPIVRAWKWGAGGRLGIGPARPEGFVQLLAAPVFDIWEPAAGLELGITARDDFSDESKLLRELRETSIADVSPFYAAIHTMPLSFRLWERFRFSALEFQVGTHLTPFGRVVRLEFGLISVGAAL
jgi:hypothetical protein